MAKYKEMYLAVAAGVLATMGGILCKWAGAVETSSLIEVGWKIILYGMMIVSNTAGCTYYVKALETSSGSSLPVTIVNATINYICSALIGYLFLGESTSWLWWCGAFFVFLGLSFIFYTPVKETSKFIQKEKEF